MIIIGVDPGTTNVGVGVIELKNDKVKLVAAYHIRSRHKDIFKRYEEIYRQISDIFTEHEPDVVGIEDQFFRNNAQTLSKLSFVTGAIWASAFVNTGAEIEVIYPTQWRKLAVQDGSAKKNDVIEYVTNMFKLKDKGYPSDVYEAVGIALAMAHRQLDT